MKPSEADGVHKSDGSAPSPPTLLEALQRHLPKLVPLAAGFLLLTEAILAAAIVFSRMTPIQQFGGVLLIVALPAAVFGYGFYYLSRVSSPRRNVELHGAATASPLLLSRLETPLWNPPVGKTERDSSPPPVELGSTVNELTIIAEQLEEMSARAKHLPFNMIGLNDQQFTYLLVKLRSTCNALQPYRAWPAGGSLDAALAVSEEAVIQSVLKNPPKTSEAAHTPPSVEAADAAPEPRNLNTVTAARDSLRKRDFDTAIAGLKSLLETNSDDAEAAELLGIAYERSGDMDSALEAMRVAVLIDPNRCSTHYNYAVLLAKAGRLLDAYRQNEVALRLNPQYSSARDLQKSLQGRITLEQESALQAYAPAADSAISA